MKNKTKVNLYETALKAVVMLAVVLLPSILFAQWTTVGNAGFSAAAITNAYSAAATDANGVLYVAFIDAGNGNKASVMKYNGSSWVTVGSTGFSAGQVSDIDLAIDPGGTPYVIYQDFANGHKPTVMKFNGSTWVNVGNTNSFGSVTNTNIAIDASGTPYVFYRGITGLDGSGDSVITMVVKKYNGSTWGSLGGTSFPTIYDLWYADFALAPDGTPYVAYSDGDDGGNVSVKKYDGSNWVYAGTQGFSFGVGVGTIYGSGAYPRLAIDGGGTPYILFTTHVIVEKLTVMKYNGINWITVGGGAPGSASFTATDSTATNPSLVLSPGGTPYVAYKDHNGAISVKKYDGSNWVYVGSANFTAGSSEYPMLAFTPNGTLYMAYADGGNAGKASAKMFANPLPLSQILLTAQQKENDIQLQWNIPGEETALRYEVEYSKDGRSFEKLASQTANGAKVYNWLHTSVSGTMHYYRIKSIAVNSSATYSAVAKVNTAKTGASISIYPNPVKQGDAINISLNNLEKGMYNLRLIDATGKVIFQKQIDHSGGSVTEWIATAKLAAGAYTIHITGQESKLIERLLIR